MQPDELVSVRSLIERFPRWLQASVLGKILYVAGLHFDALVEWLQVATLSRFPGVYSWETLPLHSRERQIDQGIGESDEHFAERLSRFLDTHATRGGPYALLEQVYERYRFSPGGAFTVHLFYQSGQYYQMTSAGVVTRTDVVVSTGTAGWAHWWLVYEWPTVVADDGTWDSDGDDGGWWDTTPEGAWDVDMPYSEVASIRLIPHKWNNAHSIGHVILLGPGQALWDIPDEDWNVEEDWDEGGDLDIVEFVIS